MFSEAVLLLVAAQTGFIDALRAVTNVALDSRLPRRFSPLSDRLTMQNGILLIGVVDSAFFRSEDHVGEIEARTRENLARYVGLAQKLGFEASSAYRLGTDVVQEASTLCSEIAARHPRSIVFAGELLFRKPQWWHRFLHNETAYAIQRQLRSSGMPMVIMPLLLENAPGELSEFAPLVGC